MVKYDRSDSAIATIRGLRVTPQKTNDVLKMIRGLHVSKALDCLATSRRRVANDLSALLSSAISNAENNNGLDIDRLYVAEASVGKAFVLKRFRARARGRAGKILKPASNVRILLKEQDMTKEGSA